jgi:hypothetical protein
MTSNVQAAPQSAQDDEGAGLSGVAAGVTAPTTPSTN